MSLRIDLDFQHGLAEPTVERAGDGAVTVRLVRGEESAVIHLSLASLEALWLALTVRLAELRRS